MLQAFHSPGFAIFLACFRGELRTAALLTAVAGAVAVVGGVASAGVEAYKAASAAIENGAQQMRDHALGEQLYAHAQKGHSVDLLAKELGKVCFLALAGYEGELLGVGNDVGKYIHSFARIKTAKGTLVDPLRLALVADTMDEAIKKKMGLTQDPSESGCMGGLAACFKTWCGCCFGKRANAKSNDRRDVVEGLAFSLAVLSNSNATGTDKSAEATKHAIMLATEQCVFHVWDWKEEVRVLSGRSCGEDGRVQRSLDQVLNSMDHLVSSEKAKEDVKKDVKGKCSAALLTLAAQIRKHAQKEQEAREKEMKCAPPARPLARTVIYASRGTNLNGQARPSRPMCVRYVPAAYWAWQGVWLCRDAKAAFEAAKAKQSDLAKSYDSSLGETKVVQA